MRGQDKAPDGLFSYVSLEDRVPTDHPLRPIRALADQALAGRFVSEAELGIDEGRPAFGAGFLEAIVVIAKASAEIPVQALGRACPMGRLRSKP